MTANKIATSGPCLTLYYSEEPDIDAEVCESVARAFPDGERAKFHTLPSVEQAACVVHHGPFTTIGEAHGFLLKWMDTNGYECVGPVREVYLQEAKHDGANASQTDSATVTEIQYPVGKKK
jgi:effector-binding domain-containing protein